MLTILLSAWTGGSIAVLLMCISTEAASDQPMPTLFEMCGMFIVAFAWPVTLPFGIYLDRF